MTKVARLYEEEKQEAVNLARKDERVQIAENLIKADADILMIMQGTGLTREQIEEIRNNMLTTKQGIKSRLSFTEMYLAVFFYV